MSEGVVFSLGVHDLGDGLVGDKLSGGERNGHAEGGRVGDVEGLETLGAVKGFGALGNALVDRAVNLHTLLDN